MKKIRGTIHYFGRWAKVENGKLVRVENDGWEEALRIYRAKAEDLHAGRKPRGPADEECPSVGKLCNTFLTAKLRALEAGEITSRTFNEYRATTDRITSAFGSSRRVDDIRPSDFEKLRAEIAKSNGFHRIANIVQYVLTVFKYGFESGLLKTPIRFGPTFKKPAKRVLRKHRAESVKKLFTADEIRAIVDASSPQLAAMILLGVNAGFGNADVAGLTQSVLDLKSGWVAFPRPKTGIDRKAKLWPETVEALRKAIAVRPRPHLEVDADLVFVTKYGARWVRTVLKEKTEEGPKSTPVDSVGLEFRKLIKELKLEPRGFYALRHSFRTISDATKDFPAIRLIMGHADGSIDDVYREGIDDHRLVAVADHVHAWLFPKAETAPKDERAARPKQLRKPRPKADDSAEKRPTLRLYAGEGEVA